MVIKFFSWKGLNATEISNELDSVYKDDTPSYPTITKWIAEFKDREHAFEDSPRTDCPSTIITDHNIEDVEWIIMRDRQISVHRLPYKLPTTVYEIMSNDLDMKKVSTR